MNQRKVAITETPLTDEDKQALLVLRTLYRTTKESMQGRFVDFDPRIRESLISKGNPVVGELQPAVFNRLLRNTADKLLGRGGMRVSDRALEKALMRMSLGPLGVIPNDARGCGMHVDVMIEAITEILSQDLYRR